MPVIITKQGEACARSNFKHLFTVITQSEARKQELSPLSGPYVTSEYWMLTAAVADMKRGNIKHAVVRESELNPLNLCLYRSNIGFLRNIPCN